ncbi:MAG: lasso peptide biosynthesis B2 protein [Desulfobulbaceae bacterium]|nr:MAG: lasso peptide biosynthesis B2 protein [Desulfobulbaceae bacterium]
MINRLKRFFSLTHHQRWFFLKALAQLNNYYLLLKTNSFKTLLERTKTHSAASEDSAVAISEIEAIRLFRAAVKLVPYAKCLAQALAGHQLFLGYGLSTTLHIGVSHDPDDGFEAHAWLKRGEIIVTGGLPDLDKYQEIPLDRALSSNQGMKINRSDNATT